MSVYEEKNELRQLEFIHFEKLSRYLDVDDAWKRLMSEIPTQFRPFRTSEKRFRFTDISTIESESRRSGSPTKLFLEEWCTMGQFRPTIGDLLYMCKEIGSLDAAGYIATRILGRPDELPELDIAFDDEAQEENFDHLLEDLEDLEIGVSEILSDGPIPVHPKNTLVVHAIENRYLNSITEGFHEKNFLGEGGYAKVYLGITRRKQAKVAIKKLKVNGPVDSVRRQLDYEIDQLPRLRHPNIIELLGFSNDNAECLCLVYRFMENGTLEKKLRVDDPVSAIPGKTRWQIARGIADGLRHLHKQQKPLIHRDVKSSNILLDGELCPKIADFGSLRFGVSGDGDTQTYTMTVNGTPEYMAPEAIRGDISAKMDVWAYGVVLLELISGYPVRDQNRSQKDLVTYFEEICRRPGFSVEKVLDPKASWDICEAERLYLISVKCRELFKDERPSMEKIIQMIDDD